jgi:hypothetical protein
MVRVWHSCPLGMVEYTPILSKIMAHGGIEVPACWEPRRCWSRGWCRIRRRRRSRRWGWANRYWIRG